MSTLSQLFKKRNNQENPLFNIAPKPSTQSLTRVVKKPKAQAQPLQKQQRAGKIDQQAPASTKQDRKKSQNKETKTEEQKKPLEDEQPQDLEATIFVGNVPLNIKRSDLRQTFSQYGKILKIWFRSIPVENNKMGPKASHILKKYAENADTMNAYVKFQSQDCARAALECNGRQVQDKTIRVTMCMDKELDTKTTIFVGNLPFDLGEQQLRSHFKKAGKIENVRVIKSSHTHQGVGIGYVKFSTAQEMQNAIASLNGSMINERPIRVKRAVEKARLEKKIKKVMQKKQMKQKGNQKSKGFRNNAPEQSNHEPKKFGKTIQKDFKKPNDFKGKFQHGKSFQKGNFKSRGPKQNNREFRSN